MKCLCLVTLLVTMTSLQACKDAPSKKPSRDAKSDAGAADASSDHDPIQAVDSGSSMSCDDDPATPGNDCSDAVGCRKESACALDTHSCCVPGFDAPAVACIEGLTCKTGGRTNCDGPEDCEGNACCVDISVGSSSCVATPACGSAGIQTCHSDADCEAGKSCNQGASFTWWGFCN